MPSTLDPAKPKALSVALAELKETLRQRFPDALPLTYRTVRPVATGIARLDVLLPGGGLPRGRPTVWMPGGGATAVLRAACHAAVERGERAAWIDAAGTVAADAWREGPLLLRTGDETEALVCAEELLRSGGFALVVLAGCRRGVERAGVRLGRAAREGGAAFVALGGDVPVAHLRLASRISPDDYRWVRGSAGEPAEVVGVTVQVAARSLGWSGETSFRLPVQSHAQRMAPAPWLADRRGVKRKRGWGIATGRPVAAPSATSTASAPARSRSSKASGRLRPETRAWAAARAFGRRG